MSTPRTPSENRSEIGSEQIIDAVRAIDPDEISAKFNRIAEKSSHLVEPVLEKYYNKALKDAEAFLPVKVLGEQIGNDIKQGLSLIAAAILIPALIGVTIFGIKELKRDKGKSNRKESFRKRKTRKRK